MAKIYIAKQSVGKFVTGDEVVGLTDDRAAVLLEAGAIEAVEAKAAAADVEAAEPKAEPKNKAKANTKK